MKKIIKWIVAFFSGFLAALFFVNRQNNKDFQVKEESINDKFEKIKETPAQDIVNNNADITSVEADIGRIQSDFRARVRNRFQSELHGNRSNSDDTNNP